MERVIYNKSAALSSASQQGMEHCMDYSGGRTGATYSENMMGNHGEAKHAITRSKDLTVSDHYTPEVVLSSAYNSLSVLADAADLVSQTGLDPDDLLTSLKIQSSQFWSAQYAKHVKNAEATVPRGLQTPAHTPTPVPVIIPPPSTPDTTTQNISVPSQSSRKPTVERELRYIHYQHSSQREAVNKKGKNRLTVDNTSSVGSSRLKPHNSQPQIEEQGPVAIPTQGYTDQIDTRPPKHPATAMDLTTPSPPKSSSCGFMAHVLDGTGELRDVNGSLYDGWDSPGVYVTLLDALSSRGSEDEDEGESMSELDLDD